MQKRENLLYVGIDLHKESHTAVMVNCWNEKLEVVVIENKPSEFKKLAEKVNRKSNHLGLEPIYGLENAYGYGRSLAVWLIEKGYIVKDINPAMAYDQRKSAPMLRKNDEHDAYCVATVLINQLPNEVFNCLNGITCSTIGFKGHTGLTGNGTSILPYYWFKDNYLPPWFMVNHRIYRNLVLW
ncbi:transposase [Anaerocolumna sp. AGMB13020]|uniref:IS110 family transposase n=1 Tax=Anaerocolumna sp. AGMB13020 TaxID=3081750 RepID=UPI002952AE52|nr:transposase [Anaerocolumna sp. AGMB13020]WOO35668.1 transposase [Anaerocolumna sp. AGMB13020]